jgi:hypothetical protein
MEGADNVRAPFCTQGYSLQRMALLQQLQRTGVSVAHLDLDEILASVAATSGRGLDIRLPLLPTPAMGTHADNASGADSADVDQADRGDNVEGLIADALGSLSPHIGRRTSASKSGHPVYDALVSSVERQIRQLRVVLESAEAKEKERE